MKVSSKTEKEWKALILEWQSSGISRNKWCKDNDITVNTFRYWQRKLLNGDDSISSLKNNSTEWVPVNVAAEVVHINQNRSIDISIGNIKIVVEKGFDSELLIDVIKLLLSCF